MKQITELRIDASAGDVNSEVHQMPEGHEMILLVDDDEQVRTVSQAILEACGYQVIAAANGAEALLMWDPHGSVKLLLTDVVMPDLDGCELAEILLLKDPNLKVLFTSGYPDDVVVSHGVVEANTDFIQKPYRLDELTQKVRKVLDQVVERG